MSKSLKLNLGDDLLDEVGYGPFRTYSHNSLSSTFKYSEEILKQAVTDYERIYQLFSTFRRVELANGSKRK